MKRNGKNMTIPILLVVIVLLLSCYFALTEYNTGKEEAAEREKEENTIYLTDLENVSAVRYDIGTGELAFVREDDTWYVDGDPDFPLTQSYPEQIVSCFGRLEAVRELEDGDDLQAYGLTEPTYTVELTDEDGTQTKLLIGDVTGDNYYATVDGTGKVYTISSTVISDLQYTLEDMAELDTVPSIGSGNFVKETITEGGNITVYDSENDEDTEAAATVVGGLGVLSLSTVANYSAEENELAQYGLDESSRITVEAVYTSDEEEQTLTFYIGKESGQDTNYFMLSNSDIVYEVSSEVCDNILNR